MSRLTAAAASAHAAGGIHARRVRCAMEIIDGAASARRMGISVSWGVDSTAMLSVIEEVHPGLPIVHYRWPECMRPSSLDDVRDACLRRWPREMWTLSRSGWSGPTGHHPPCRQEPSDHPPSVYVEVLIAGPPEVWRRFGTAFQWPATAAQRAISEQVLREDGRLLEEAYGTLGVQGMFVALRAQESRRREVAVSARGTSWWSTEWQMHTVVPIAWWRHEDVEARLTITGLPRAGHYGHGAWLGDDRRIRSEMGLIRESQGSWQHGAGGFWAHADPEMWARLVAEFPECESWR